jgi:hypothetical protein
MSSAPQTSLVCGTHFNDLNRHREGDGVYDVLVVGTRGFKGRRAVDETGLPMHVDNQTIFKERNRRAFDCDLNTIKAAKNVWRFLGLRVGYWIKPIHTEKVSASQYTACCATVSRARIRALCDLSAVEDPEGNVRKQGRKLFNEQFDPQVHELVQRILG